MTGATFAPAPRGGAGSTPGRRSGHAVAYEDDQAVWNVAAALLDAGEDSDDALFTEARQGFAPSGDQSSNSLLDVLDVLDD